MGHCVGFITVDERNKYNSEVLCVEDESVRYSYGGGWSLSMVEWLNHEPFASSDEAEEYLEEVASRNKYRFRDNIAVRYMDTEETIHKGNAKTKNLIKRIEELERKRGEYIAKNSIFNRTSSFIGCKECGSKLSIEAMKKKNRINNRCPVCGHDLRSDTVKSAISRYDERIAEAKKNLKSEQRAIAKKAAKNKKTRWLVRYDYHI